MNDYDDKCLETVEELASLFLSIKDIAISINVRHEQLLSDIKKEGSPVNIAYYRGKVKSKVELHRQEMKLAMSGSPLGMDSAKHFLDEMEEGEL